MSVALIPLKAGNGTIGLLQLCDNKPGTFTENSIHFFEDLGESIGIAVSKLIDEEKREKLIIKNEKLLHNLNERVKELTCLYEISRLLEKVDLTYSDLLQEIINLIPAAMQYPEITCVRINIGDQKFVTKDFMETPWAMRSKINVYETSIGYLEIFYKEKMPKQYEGSFLREERELVDAVAERISRIMERKKELEWNQNIDRYALILNFDELMQLHANVSHIVQSMDNMIKQSIERDKIEHAKTYYLRYRDTDLRLLNKMEQLETTLRERTHCRIS